MRVIAATGFRGVINNRPDFEGGADQPTSVQLEAAAKNAGLDAPETLDAAKQPPTSVRRLYISRPLNVGNGISISTRGFAGRFESEAAQRHAFDEVHVFLYKEGTLAEVPKR
jgi:hypothetical protein